MESDNDSDIDDILDNLLANEDGTEPVEPKKKLSELSFSFLDSQQNVTPSKSDTDKGSQVHDRDIDSSDEEDKRNFEEQRYSEYGRDVKNLLKNENVPKTFEIFSKNFDKTPNNNEKNSEDIAKVPKTSVQSSFYSNGAKKKIIAEKQIVKSNDVYSDPIFGLRLAKPLISSAQLIEKMKGRTAVKISRVKSHLASENLEDDWVIAGVLINRSLTKTSQKGTQYCIWKLSDLGDKMNTVSLFLFSGAYKLFWKTAAGVVVGILNPNVMDSKDNYDLATLSVDNAQKVMILGNSRDMGKCKAMKKNGEPCSNVVNLSTCEYCVYHVKQEYQKASRRADIQSNGNSNGFSPPMSKKMKPPLAGMYSQSMNNQNFTLIPAKRNEKLYAKDSARLALLRGTNSMPAPPAKVDNLENKKKSCSVELTASQMKKDLEKLNKLRGWNVSKAMCVTTSGEVPNFISTPKKTTSLQMSSLTTNASVPRLGLGLSDGKIDFSQPITKKHMDKARLNAARWIKENGTLKKSNPNKICESREKKLDSGTKRRREDDAEHLEIEKNKKKALISDKFKEMLEAKSSHVDLVENSQEEEKEKYFDKLEIKERMEQKMMTTYKVECKAVKCLICKYTAFSGSDLCKQQKHPLRVIDAVKSFFKCQDCGNRTTSLDRMPSESCNKCRGSHWVRAAMMAEKRTDIPSIALSIRGGEEKFIGSISQDANINLLVPDSGTADC